MSDLTDFLLARIADDEEWGRVLDDWIPTEIPGSSYAPHPLTVPDSPVNSSRVLAECAAKRRIVRWAQQWPLRRGSAGDGIEAEDSLLGILAAVYADHPDYRQEWR